jgi:hypothetical protein
LLGADPRAGSELPNGRLVETAAGVADGILERGADGERCLSQSAGETAVVQVGPLAVDDHAELFLEGELV